MSLIKLNKKLNNIAKTNFKNIKIANECSLNVVDNKIEFNINGTPSNIIINYNGTGNFISKMPITLKTKIGKSVILITNIFKKDIPEIILEYFGDIIIYSCEVTNFDGSKIRATINNNQQESLLNKSETNVEDDTLTLFEEPKQIKKRSSLNSGLIEPTIKSNSINTFGKIQKFGKIEKEDLINIVTKSTRKTIVYNPLKEAKQRAEKPTSKPSSMSEKPIRNENKPQNKGNRIYEGGKK